jgi:hypothetical protein
VFEIVSLLRESKLFSDIEVLELIDEDTIKVIKVRAKVIDGTILFIHEIFRINSHKYSYHWQEKDGKVIIRWDNSPHWKKVKTFPYHKHIADDVFSCQKMSISDVISEIEGKIKDANSAV